MVVLSISTWPNVNADGTITLYHYTDQDGKNGIVNSGYIQIASRFAHYGPYVYLTSLSPFNHSRRQIALNNMNNAAYTRKTNYVFEVLLSRHWDKVQHTNPPGRDVYRYTNGALILAGPDVLKWTLYDWRTSTGQFPIRIDGSPQRLGKRSIHKNDIFTLWKSYFAVKEDI